MPRFTRTLPLLLAVVVCTLVQSSIGRSAISDKTAWGVSDNAFLLPPPSVARIASFGYNEALADIYLIRAVVYSSAVTKEERKRGYRHLDRFLESMLAVSPGYRSPFEFAVNAMTYRSEITDIEGQQRDFRSSAYYYEKAIKYFPNDWEFHYKLAQRYKFFIRPDDPEETERLHARATLLAERAILLPGAPAKAIAQDLHSWLTEAGQKDKYIRILMDQWYANDVPRIRKQIEEQMKLAGAEFAPQDERELIQELLQKKKEQYPLESISFYLIAEPGGESPWSIPAYSAPTDSTNDKIESP